MAPEVIKQKGYGRKADIWSVGCVALEMMTARKPWELDENHIMFMMKMVSENTIPEIPSGISPSAKDFLLQCFQRDPSSRKSAKELLNHEFLKQLGI
jgi:serine/threonine protein kinase